MAQDSRHSGGLDDVIVARSGARVGGLVRQDAITELVRESRQGERDARDALYGVVYEQLHRIAVRQQQRWPSIGDTMRPTVLVSELFVEFERRFPDTPSDRPEDRAWFYGCAAAAMRNILRKHWRQVARRKPLQIGERDPAAVRGDLGASDYLDLDAAFDRLRDYNERWHQIAMLKYFAGRTNDQISEMVGRSKAVIKQDWAWCKAWLARELDSRR